MRDFNSYLDKICTEQDLNVHVDAFQKEIQRQQQNLQLFIVKARERLNKVSEYEQLKQYKVMGGVYRVGKQKGIVLIIRYPDGTQKTERYYFDKIADLRVKLAELRSIHSDVDWSGFDEKLR